MRIRLIPGKQKELIISAKRELTWSQLGKMIGLAPLYLAIELKNEKRLLSEEVYEKLCVIAGTNYDKDIQNKLDDNWGKSKGARNSIGNTKKFQRPEESAELAELIGIILGDGHLEYIVRGKKVRAYSLTVTGHSVKDFNYLSNWVNELVIRLIGNKPTFRTAPDKNAMFLKIHGKEMVNFFKDKGLKPGNKKLNNQTIPKWILNNGDYLASCLRGLVDTDGSVHYISKNNRNIRICFTSYIPALLKDVRESFIKLDYHPSKIITGNQIFITRKEDVEKYYKIIKFHNEKHLKRFESLKQQALVV